MTQPTPTSTQSPPLPYPLWAAYVVPMALFMALTALEGYAPKQYVWLVLAKAVVVTMALVYFRPPWKEIRAEARVLVPAVVVGLVVFAEWVLLDRWIPYPHIGSRAGLNPFTAIESEPLRLLFLVIRFYVLVLMVPVMEEIFWRSFLLRYFTNPDFAALPVGTFSWGAFALVAGGFALAHSEWLVALLCAAAYGLLLRQTRSLFACIVAHAVTNLALGIYILIAHDWKYW